MNESRTKIPGVRLFLYVTVLCELDNHSSDIVAGRQVFPLFSSLLIYSSFIFYLKTYIIISFLVAFAISLTKMRGNCLHGIQYSCFTAVQEI